MKLSANFLAKTAITAALYVVLTLVFTPISFGSVQIRVATGLYQFVAVDKRYYLGMVLGVTIANLFSPFGLVDVLAGLVVTGGGLALAIGLNRFVKNLHLRFFITGICVTVPMFAVAFVLKYVGNVPIPLPILYLYLMIGQALAQILGFLFVSLIRKSPVLRDKIFKA